MATIEDTMRESQLRWFGNKNQRPTDASVRRCDCETEAQGKKGRGRLRETLKETIKKDTEYLKLTMTWYKTERNGV